MQRLIVRIENCYGIGKLEYEFDFQMTKVYSIYAPNGFMKTSFAKTFLDLSNNNAESSDLIHPERQSRRTIQDEYKIDVNEENVFVIEPYNQDYESNKTSLLLVNPTLKKEYDEALSKIEYKKDELFNKLKQLSSITGKTNTPETELLKCFGKASIFDLLESFEKTINESTDERLAVISYSALFNDRTVALLDSGQISTQLKDYIDKYNELVDNSQILSRTFNHYHAKVVQKNLSDNGFFSAKHTVNLFNGTTKEEITSADVLEERIEDEKNKILSNADLNKKFDEIDKKLTTKELREFRNYLLYNKDIVPELADYRKLQKEIWIAYLSSQKDMVNALLYEYKSGKEIIQKTIKIAKRERTEWEEVVEIFNRRFSVPFKLAVTNQEDVILKDFKPLLAYIFQDDDDRTISKEVDKGLLLKVLSRGEKRALYLLNILFELNARRKQCIKTIIIADDVADSFDYKNKYAIVEYLKENAELENFYFLFLTHNYDFHRTISERLDIWREYRLVAVKNGRNLTLKQETYKKNPFDHWKKNLKTDQRYVISAIPFIRNLADYCGKQAEYSKLTSLLHIRNDSSNFVVQDLETIYKDVLNNPSLTLSSPNKPVIDLIFELADAIQIEPNETAELESKIILSIAIRLKAEILMINKIKDQKFLEKITKNQTTVLLKQFKKDFPGNAKLIALLEQVNLMTPENIHLNSFMYEPILDMAPEHLKRLYADLKIANP